MGINDNTRVIDFCGESIEVDTFQEKHKYSNQKVYERGIPVNPILRDYFDMTPNEYREQEEIDEWWGKPYIISSEFTLPDQSYSDYVNRVSKYENTLVKTEDEYNAYIKERRAKWFDAWPTGVRYESRCLDGGAWDRSTSRGMFPELSLAVEACL